MLEGDIVDHFGQHLEQVSPEAGSVVLRRLQSQRSVCGMIDLYRSCRRGSLCAEGPTHQITPTSAQDLRVATNVFFAAKFFSLGSRRRPHEGFISTQEQPQGGKHWL